MSCPSGDAEIGHIVDHVSMPENFKTGLPGYRCLPIMLSINEELANKSASPCPGAPGGSRIPIRATSPLCASTPFASPQSITEHPRQCPGAPQKARRLISAEQRQCPGAPQKSRIPVAAPRINVQAPSPVHSASYSLHIPQCRAGDSNTSHAMSIRKHESAMMTPPPAFQEEISFGGPPAAASTPFRYDNPELQDLEQHIHNYSFLVGQNTNAQKRFRDAKRILGEQYADASSYTQNYMMGIIESYETDLQAQRAKALQAKQKLAEELKAKTCRSAHSAGAPSLSPRMAPPGTPSLPELAFSQASCAPPSPCSPDISFGGHPAAASTPFKHDNSELKDLEQHVHNYNFLLGQNTNAQKRFGDAKRILGEQYADASSYTQNYMMGIIESYEKDLHDQRAKALETKQRLLSEMRAKMPPSPQHESDLNAGFHHSAEAEESIHNTGFIESEEEGACAATPPPSCPCDSSFEPPVAASTPFKHTDPEMKDMEQYVHHYDFLMGQNRGAQRRFVNARAAMEREYADASTFTKNYMMSIIDSYETDLHDQYKKAMETKQRLLAQMRQRGGD